MKLYLIQMVKQIEKILAELKKNPKKFNNSLEIDAKNELIQIQKSIAQSLGYPIDNWNDEKKKPILDLQLEQEIERLSLDDKSAFNIYTEHLATIQSIPLKLEKQANFIGFGGGALPMKSLITGLIEYLKKYVAQLEQLPASLKSDRSKHFENTMNTIQLELKNIKEKNQEIEEESKKIREENKTIQSLQEMNKQLQTQLLEAQSQIVLFEEKNKKLAELGKTIVIDLGDIPKGAAEKLQSFLASMGVEVPSRLKASTTTTTSTTTDYSAYRWEKLKKTAIEELKKCNPGTYHKYQLGNYLSPAKYAAMVRLVEFINEQKEPVSSSLYSSLPQNEKPKVIAEKMLLELLNNFQKPWTELLENLKQIAVKLSENLRAVFDFFNDYVAKQNDDNKSRGGINKENAFQMFFTAFARGDYFPQNNNYAQCFQKQLQVSDQCEHKQGNGVTNT